MNRKELLENSKKVTRDGEEWRQVKACTYVFIDGKRVGSGKLFKIDSGAKSPLKVTLGTSQASGSTIIKDGENESK